MNSERFRLHLLFYVYQTSISNQVSQFSTTCSEAVVCKEECTCSFTWYVISHFYSVFWVVSTPWTKTHQSTLCLYYGTVLFLFKMLKKPHWMITGLVPPTSFSMSTFNGFAEESFGKTATYYICSLIQFVKEPHINYENAKTLSKSIHLPICSLDTVIHVT